MFVILAIAPCFTGNITFSYDLLATQIAVEAPETSQVNCSLIWLPTKDTQCSCMTPQWKIQRPYWRVRRSVWLLTDITHQTYLRITHIALYWLLLNDSNDLQYILVQISLNLTFSKKDSPSTQFDFSVSGLHFPRTWLKKEKHRLFGNFTLRHCCTLFYTMNTIVLILIFRFSWLSWVKHNFNLFWLSFVTYTVLSNSLKCIARTLAFNWLFVVLIMKIGDIIKRFLGRWFSCLSVIPHMSAKHITWAAGNCFTLNWTS